MRYDPCEATYVTCEKAVSQRNHGTDGVHPGSHVRSEVVHSYQGNKELEITYQRFEKRIMIVRVLLSSVVVTYERIINFRLCKI